MHDKKIVHNDLKLENWLFEDQVRKLLSEAGQLVCTLLMHNHTHMVCFFTQSPSALLKLIDFGFSKHLVSCA